MHDDDEERKARRREQDRIRRGFPAFRLPPFECDSGWYDLLESLFEEFEKIIPKGKEDGLRVSQIKEKFGGLNVYYSYAFSEPNRGEVHEIRRRLAVADFLAECRAARTCEVCGNRGVLRQGGWIRTLCDLHAEGRQAFPEERGRGRERPRMERWTGNGKVFQVYEYDEAEDRVIRLPDKTRQD